jgi:hypothetical protein
MLRYSSEEVGESGGSSREPSLYVPELHRHKPQNSWMQLSINVWRGGTQDNALTMLVAQAFKSQGDHRVHTAPDIANELSDPKH